MSQRIQTRTATDKHKVSIRRWWQTGHGTYAFDKTSTDINFNVVHNLLDLSLDLVLGLQHLASLYVQEAESVNITEGVEELCFGEGVFGVILGLLERDTGLRVFGQLLTSFDRSASLTTWVATH